MCPYDTGKTVSIGDGYGGVSQQGCDIEAQEQPRVVDALSLTPPDLGCLELAQRDVVLAAVPLDHLP